MLASPVAMHMKRRRRQARAKAADQRLELAIQRVVRVVQARQALDGVFMKYFVQM